MKLPIIKSRCPGDKTAIQKIIFGNAEIIVIEIIVIIRYNYNYAGNKGHSETGPAQASIGGS
jgi:hypothetical protein